MSVDTVNSALTNVRLRIIKHPDSYSQDGQRKLLAMCDVMRAYLMEEDTASFDGYINLRLASDTDAMTFLLDELFEELGFPEGIREQLSAELAA